MATKKSSTGTKVKRQKNDQVTKDIVASGSARRNLQSKKSSSKKNTASRSARVVQRRSPNTAAASDVVSKSVANYVASKPDPAQLTETSKNQAKKRKQPAEKQVRPKEESRTQKAKILDEGAKKRAPRPAKKSATTESTAKKQQRPTTKKRATKKQSAKRVQSAIRDAEVQKPDGKKTERKRRRPQTRTSKSTVVKSKTTPSKQTLPDTPPKASPRKTSAKATDQSKKATAKTKSKTQAKKKPSRKMKKSLAPARTHQPAEKLTDDFVIGFQGIYYKPYRLTSRDLFMSGAQQDHFMDILTRAKEKLLAEEADRASQLQENDASNLPDPLDQGTNEGVFHNQLRTRDRESQLVRKINRAIDCLKTGSYGYCEACGCEIPIRRLEARPIVTKCIDCKERDELRERQLGQ